MRKTDDYLLDLSATPDKQEIPAVLAERVFDLAWRFDFSAPGFCLLDLGQGVDSHAMRSTMLSLKDQLSEIAVRRFGRRFACRSVGSFDQQVTTKFHVDGAPAESMLILGYEPSRVRSRLFLADFSQCAFDQGIEPQQFLTDFNPMYRQGEEMLSGYVTELPPAAEGQSRILLINNSSLPFTEARTNSLGVMHKAEVINATETERRIVNSMMLKTADESDTEEVGDDQQKEFVATERISQKVYG